MDTQFTPFMRDLERRFRVATGLPNRSQYKIFYGQIRPALIRTLGINPGEDPRENFGRRLYAYERQEGFGLIGLF